MKLSDRSKVKGARLVLFRGIARQISQFCNFLLYLEATRWYWWTPTRRSEYFLSSRSNSGELFCLHVSNENLIAYQSLGFLILDLPRYSSHRSPAPYTQLLMGPASLFYVTRARNFHSLRIIGIHLAPLVGSLCQYPPFHSMAPS